MNVQANRSTVLISFHKMKSFSKLVQEKRVKMLFLCLFLFGLIFSQSGSSVATDLTLIVKKEGDTVLPSCLAEGNERHEGIAWIYPFSENIHLPQEERRILPTIQNSFNCKFSTEEQCTKVWAMINWSTDIKTTRKFDFISDERWEDFPTHYISNETKEFKHRVEIPEIFKLGFSVRASDAIELFLCEGWDPTKYPCYYFNITSKKIELSRHTTISGNDLQNAIIMDSYESLSANIISRDEWRNFELAKDEMGQITLLDVNLNRTVIEKMDPNPIKPAYFFYRSPSPSLWKIHQSEFFYTETSQTSRLGPTLRITSTDLCVNLFVSTCSNCTITFFMIVNGTKSAIGQRVLKTSGQWSLINLSKEKILVDHINIFTETLYKPNTENRDGFWAIDDVRVCHEKEVKINLLNSLNGGDTGVTCQIVDKPNLRPEKVVYKYHDDYPIIESMSDSSSINLTWTPDKWNKNMKYFIRYQGNDLCQDPAPNSKRLKSNGFIVTTSKEANLKNLIPYTSYTIGFSSMLHPNEKIRALSTKESSYISFDELPRRIRIDRITDTTAKISWDQVECEKSYGPILYGLELSDEKTHKVTNLGIQAENTKEITALRPNSKYVLSIVTSRRDGVSRFNTSMFFTTKAGLAPPPQNLEIYSTSNNSLSLRYNVPDKNEGQPVEVHITRCNPLTLKKCKARQDAVIPCKLFPGKYCLHIPNLIPHQKQLLRISLKNEGTHTFGEEVVISGKTEEREPGRPTNVTYKLVDCTTTAESCNLNISWLHPYEQNGRISGFRIILNSSEIDNKTGSHWKSFEETYKVVDQNYLYKYTYQIKHIPYSKKYNLFIQSINDDFKSDFTTKTVIHTINLGDLIDQSPVLVTTSENSMEFELKPPDPRLSTTLTVIVQDLNENKTIDEKIANEIELADNLCNDFGETWISQTIKITDSTRKITLGNSDTSGKSLQPDTKYCITFLMENEYRNSSHMNVYYETIKTLPHFEEEKKQIVIYLLILLAFIILALGLVYFVWHLKKKHSSKRPSVKPLDMDEHAYESLPFEDNIVNNNMYDHLDHK